MNTAVGALRLAVDLARHQLLAGAVLAEDEHVGVGRRRLAARSDTVAHRPATCRGSRLAGRSVSAGNSRFCRLRLAASRRLARSFTAARTVATSFSFCQGLATKSDAPRFIASTAVSTRRVRRDQHHHRAAGRCSRIRASQSSPSRPDRSPVHEIHVEQDGVERVFSRSSAGMRSGWSVGQHLAEVALRAAAAPAVRMSLSSSTIRIEPVSATAASPVLDRCPESYNGCPQAYSRRLAGSPTLA